jgi:hypothetical protein
MTQVTKRLITKRPRTRHYLNVCYNINYLLCFLSNVLASCTTSNKKYHSKWRQQKVIKVNVKMFLQIPYSINRATGKNYIKKISFAYYGLTKRPWKNQNKIWQATGKIQELAGNGLLQLRYNIFCFYLWCYLLADASEIQFKKFHQGPFHYLGRFVIWVFLWHGTFCDGTFSAGLFCDMGPFVTGSFRDGTLCDGSFCDGLFRDGTFCMWIEKNEHQIIENKWNIHQ